MKQVLQEALVVAVSGALLAFLANGLSPRGLKLTRNYQLHRPVAATLTATPPDNTHPAPGSEQLAAELKQEGLQLAGSNLVLRLFHAAGYQQGLIAFVDARHADDYEQGHIPAAYLFDYAHPETYLPTVFPACQTALQVVVYCTGGHCEDSERAAIFLRDLGIPRERLFVYGGGITEWRANALPIEVGDRRSGRVLNAKP